MITQGQSKAVGTWWYWVSRRRYCLTYDGTGSVSVGTVDTWWYRVSMERYWFIYDGTGSVEGGTGRYLMVLGQKKVVLVDT